jgi:hypothetical protein
MSSRSRNISGRSLPRYKRILPDWDPAQKGDRAIIAAMCAENYPRPATQKGCSTAHQELPRQRVGLGSPDHSDAHDSNAGRGPASKRPQDCASARLALQRLMLELQATHWRRLQYRTGDVVRRHRWRTRASRATGYTVAVPVEDLRRRVAGAGAREDSSRRTLREPAAGVMDRWRSGALLDWDNLPGSATRLLRLE